MINIGSTIKLWGRRFSDKNQLDETDASLAVTDALERALKLSSGCQVWQSGGTDRRGHGLQLL